jgi:hypothetical protein
MNTNEMARQSMPAARRRSRTAALCAVLWTSGAIAPAAHARPISLGLMAAHADGALAGGRSGVAAALVLGVGLARGTSLEVELAAALHRGDRRLLRAGTGIRYDFDDTTPFVPYLRGTLGLYEPGAAPAAGLALGVGLGWRPVAQVQLSLEGRYHTIADERFDFPAYRELGLRFDFTL